MNEIILNSVNLNISNIQFRSNDLNFPLNGSVELNEDYEQAILKFDQELNVIIFNH